MAESNWTSAAVNGRAVGGISSGEPDGGRGGQLAEPPPAYPLDTESTEGPRPSEFAELKRIVRQRGLLDKQPAYYMFKVPFTLALLGISVAVLVSVDSLWLQLLNAAFLAFAFGQIGFMGHDTGHEQIFRSPWKTKISCLCISLLLGLSQTWWIDKHNRHHSNPNDLRLDPDTFIPVVAFAESQALRRKGFYRLVVKHQSYLFYPMLCLQGLGVRLASLQYLLRSRGKYSVAEPIAMAVQLVPYVGLPIYFLGVWQGLLFLLVSQFAFGLYMGSVFAPNHKGMPVLEDDSELNFLRRQVVTARNVKGSRLTDFLYGGLNYQIEHHLFPSMPRNRLCETRKIVKAFCQARSIPYHETGVLRSHLEIIRSLHKVSSPLRGRKLATS